MGLEHFKGVVSAAASAMRSPLDEELSVGATWTLQSVAKQLAEAPQSVSLLTIVLPCFCLLICAPICSCSHTSPAGESRASAYCCASHHSLQHVMLAHLLCCGYSAMSQQSVMLRWTHAVTILAIAGVLAFVPTVLHKDRLPREATAVY